ncbi:hypothetical protein QL285_051217 [Trifolium repens]|nr:hypothetical protein QL285_051217 [Trifolium repens]
MIRHDTVNSITYPVNSILANMILSIQLVIISMHNIVNSITYQLSFQDTILSIQFIIADMVPSNFILSDTTPSIQLHIPSIQYQPT